MGVSWQFEIRQVHEELLAAMQDSILGVVLSNNYKATSVAVVLGEKLVFRLRRLLMLYGRGFEST